MSASPAPSSTPDSETTQNVIPGEDQANRGILAALVGVSSFIGRKRWPIFCLFQLGLILGLVAVRAPETHFEPVAMIGFEERANSEPEPSRSTEQSESFPLSAIERGDRLIREGRFELAFATYRAAAGSDGGEVPPLIRYRIAVCLEALGRWDAAIAEFSAVRSAGADPVFEVAAQLGQIRVWMRKGQITDAKNLVCDLLLRSGSPEFQGRSFLAETAHRLARLMAQEITGMERPGPLNPQAAAHFKEESALEYVLDWVSMIEARDDSQASPLPTAVLVDKSGESADQMIVHGSLSRTSVSEALQQLTSACDRQCLLTPQAQQEISDRSVSLTIRSLPLSSVLTGITEPLGLLWEVTENAVHVCSELEVTGEAFALHRWRYAERALVDAIERYPSHVLRALAEFELGNLAYAHGKYEDAAGRYEKLTACVPRSPVAIEASYNLGLTLRRLGRNESAREAFYRVVDGSPNHALSSLASLTIGRMYLDQAEFDRAIPPLRRAAAFATGSDVFPVAALLLSSAYLLMDKADAANALLTEHREEVAEPPYRNVAAFLGSYARMLASGGKRQAQREGRVLTWAIVSASRESVLGSTGTLLMGHAYRELGLGEKMVELYKKALHEGVPPALQPEMWFDIAEHAMTVGELRVAIHGFTDLAVSGSGKWNRLARLRLAEIAFDDGRVEDCLECCRSLLDPHDPNDAPIVLKLMGRAFELAGSHQKAAVCFAGQMPEF